MNRCLKLSLPLIFSLLVSPVHAEIYTWTDSQGTVHFTEDPGQLPKQARGKARKRTESTAAVSTIESAKPPKQAGADPVEKAAKTVQADEQPKKEKQGAARDGKKRQAETFGGRTYEQWAKDLADREAALQEIRKRTDEIQRLVDSAETKRDEKPKLVDEHLQLTEKFKAQKADYMQTVEKAQKAGLTVNIQE